MATAFRKMSYARLSALSHTPEARAELERRQSRHVESPSSLTPGWGLDFDRAVDETVTLVRRAILTRVLTHLGLPPA